MLQRLNGGTQGTIEPVDFRPACFTAVIKRPGRLLGMQHKHAEMDVPQREKHSDSADEIVKMAAAQKAQPEHPACEYPQGCKAPDAGIKA